MMQQQEQRASDNSASRVNGDSNRIVAVNVTPSNNPHTHASSSHHEVPYIILLPLFLSLYSLATISFFHSSLSPNYTYILVKI